jgi:rhodanese-related sulfurtransferase
MNRLWKQDLAWAGFILVLAAAMGLWQQWRLVPLAKEIYKLEGQIDQRRAQHHGLSSVKLATAYELFQRGRALFIDSRPAGEYSEMHIPGALNLSLEELGKEGAEKVKNIAKDRQIVVYCGSMSCDLALMVGEKLVSLGFTRVMVFLGGLSTWEKTGYPTETKPQSTLWQPVLPHNVSTRG